MGRLIYSMSVSLDGYIAGPDGDFDWGAPSPELHSFHNERVRELSVHLLGRRLYETMTYWETVDELDASVPAHVVEFARIWKQLPKIVYSNTLTSVEGKTRLSHEDPVEEVRRLTLEGGEDLAVGGATLAAGLIQAGLVDQYDLFVCPVIVGGGTPFFPSLETPIELELVESRTFSSRVVFQRYRQV
jgi:dihydrofolate reductase